MSKVSNQNSEIKFPKNKEQNYNSYKQYKNLVNHAKATLFNLFHATGLFLYPLKTLENLWFSGDFRWYRKRSVA